LEEHSADFAADLSQHDKFHSVLDSDTLLGAVEYFGQGQHRVVVLNKKKELVGLLSQSDALRYLEKKWIMI